MRTLSQRWLRSDNCECCHTEAEVVDQTVSPIHSVPTTGKQILALTQATGKLTKKYKYLVSALTPPGYDNEIIFIITIK